MSQQQAQALLATLATDGRMGIRCQKLVKLLERVISFSNAEINQEADEYDWTLPFYGLHAPSSSIKLGLTVSIDDLYTDDGEMSVERLRIRPVYKVNEEDWTDIFDGGAWSEYSHFNDWDCGVEFECDADDELTDAGQMSVYRECVKVSNEFMWWLDERMENEYGINKIMLDPSVMADRIWFRAEASFASGLSLFYQGFVGLDIEEDVNPEDHADYAEEAQREVVEEVPPPYTEDAPPVYSTDDEDE